MLFHFRTAVFFVAEKLVVLRHSWEGEASTWEHIKRRVVCTSTNMPVANRFTCMKHDYGCTVDSVAALVAATKGRATIQSQVQYSWLA